MASRNELELLLKLNDQMSQQFAAAAKTIEASGTKIASIEKRMAKETDEATKAMQRQKDESAEFKAAMGGVATSIAGIGFAGLAAGLALTTAAFIDATETGIAFEQSMANLQAILQPTTRDMEAMSNAAREIGATTKFTAGEAADAMTELGKKGFDTGQILSSTADVVAYAAANNLSMEESANQVATALRQYGLEADQAGEVSDVMAKSFTISALGADNLGEALKFVGPVARASGISLSETSAALAVLANNGLKASNAGTSLRRIIAFLSDDTSKVSRVLQKQGVPATASFQEKLDGLNKIGLSTSEAVELFGIYAQSASIILAKGAGAVSEYSEQLDIANGSVDGFTSRMAEIQMDTVAGQWKVLQSTIEELGVEFYDAFGPELKESIKALTAEAREFGAWMTENSTEVQMWSDNIVSFINVGIDAVGTLLDAWKEAARIIDMINPFKNDFADELATPEMKIGRLTEAVKNQIIELGRLEQVRDRQTKGSHEWRKSVDDVRDAMTNLKNGQDELNQSAQDEIGTLNMLRTSGYQKQVKLIQTMINNTMSLSEAKKEMASIDADALKKASKGARVSRAGDGAVVDDVNATEMLSGSKSAEKAMNLLQRVMDKAAMTAVKGEGDKIAQLEAKQNAYYAGVIRRINDLTLTREQAAEFNKALDELALAQVIELEAAKTRELEKAAEDRKEVEIEAMRVAAEAKASLIESDRDRELAELDNWYTELQGKYGEHTDAMEILTETYRAKQSAIEKKYNDIDTQQKLDAVGTLNSGLVALYKSAEVDNKAVRIALKAGMIGEATANAYLAGTKALATVPFPFNIAAAVGITAKGLADANNIRTQKFANGGMVLGNSYVGDNVPALLNSGEEVLTREDQGGVMAMIRGMGGGGGGNGLVINQTFSVGSGNVDPSVLDDFKEKVRDSVWELREEGIWT